MILGLVLSAVPMLAFAAWGIFLRIHHKSEQLSDQHWYESGIGTQAGGIHGISE